jgi:hypothetical protein
MRTSWPCRRARSAIRNASVHVSTTTIAGASAARYVSSALVSQRRSSGLSPVAFRRQI